jgi:hypothetical protein
VLVKNKTFPHHDVILAGQERLHVVSKSVAQEQGIRQMPHQRLATPKQNGCPHRQCLTLCVFLQRGTFSLATKGGNGLTIHKQYDTLGICTYPFERAADSSIIRAENFKNPF